MTRYKLFLIILIFPYLSIAQVKDSTVKENSQTQIYESLLMKNYSKKLVKQGDVRTALDFLTYTLPSNIENPERPVVQESLDQLYNIHYNEDQYAEIINNSIPVNYKYYFSKDASIMAGVSGNGLIIYLYNVAQKRSIAHISLHDSVRNVAFDNSGKMIYIQFLSGPMMTLNLENNKTSEIPLTDTLVNGYTGINVSPDGKYFLTYGNGMVKVYNTIDFTLVSEYLADIKLAKFTPCSKQLFLMSRSGHISKYDFIANTVREFSSVPAAETATLSHCGNYIAVVPSNKRKTIEIWNAETQQLVIRRNAMNYVRKIEFTADDSKIILNTHSELRSVGGVPDIFQMWHNNNILEVKISKDNKYIVTGGFDYTARLWYASNGKPVCAPLIHTRKAVRNVDFSPCGKYLITLGDNDNKVHIWDVATGKELTSYITIKPGYFYTAEFSPCGNYILTSSNNASKSCLLWDFKTQRITYPLLPHQGGVFYATFSPNGKYVATASAGFNVKVWDIKDYKGKYIADIVQEYKHTQNLRKVIFPPDNSKIAFFGNKDSTATVLDIKTGKVIGNNFRHNGNIMDIAFSCNSNMLATGATDSVAVIWDLKTGKPAVPPIRHKGKTGEVKFFSNDKYLAVACWNGYAAIWNTSNGELAMPYFRHTNRVSDIAISSDEKFMVTGSLDRSAKIWNFVSPQELLSYHKKNSETLMPKLNLGEEEFKAMYLFTEAEFALEEKDTSRAVSLLLEILPHNIKEPDKKFSPDAFQLLGTIYNGRNSRNIDLGIVNATTAKFSPDGKYLAIGSSNGKLYLFDADSYKEILQLQIEGSVNDLAITKENRYLVSLGDNGVISVYDIQARKNIGKKMIHSGASRLLISNNGDKVATYPFVYVLSNQNGESENNVKIWNIASGKLITETITFLNKIATVAFSSNDETVFITSPGKNAMLFDAINCRKIVHSIPPASYAHHGEIVCNDKYLVTMYNNEVRVSSYDDGYLVYDPIKLPSSVAKATVSPDGKYIAVIVFGSNGGVDNKIRFYDIHTGKPALYPISVNSNIWEIAFTDSPNRLLVKGDNIQIWDINLSIPVTAPLPSSSSKRLSENSSWRSGTNDFVIYNKDFVSIRSMAEMQEVIDYYRTVVQ